jgi:cytochrome c biogenesis protein CcmG/thiol:disulfide interchange protein DsbE
MATSTKSSTSGSTNSMGRWLIIAGGAVVVVILILAVALTGGSSSDVAPEDEFGSPQVDGQLPPLTDPGADAAVGTVAPDLAGQDFDGNAVALTNDGEAKAIVFLAHWCPHCQNEVPAVQGWLDDGGGVEGVAIYSVSTSMDETRVNWPASAWLEDEGWTSPVIRDDQAGTAMISFGGNAFPYWVFVNSDGTVAGRIAGGIPTDQLEEIMQSLT